VWVKNEQLWCLYDFNLIDKSNKILKQHMSWLGWALFFYLSQLFYLFFAAKYRVTKKIN